LVTRAGRLTSCRLARLGLYTSEMTAKPGDIDAGPTVNLR